MTDEEVQESVARAEAEWESLKDKVHDQYEEIEELKKARHQMAIDIHKYKTRVETALNYIRSKYDEECLVPFEMDELTDILKGDL